MITCQCMLYVPRDYDVMYAYNCGLYEQRFHLSRESVYLLLCNESNRIKNALIVEDSDLISE